eukprot:5155650-Prymnesium_polylepis.1
MQAAPENKDVTDRVQTGRVDLPHLYVQTRHVPEVCTASQPPHPSHPTRHVPEVCTASATRPTLRADAARP